MMAPSYAEQTALFWAEVHADNPGWLDGWWEWRDADPAEHAANRAAAVAEDTKARAAAAAARKAQEADKARAEAWRRHRASWTTCGVPGRYNGCTFDNFRSDTDQQRNALEVCRRFPYLSDDQEDTRTARNLWLLGTVGAGKTHLACALLRELHSQGLSVVFTTPRDLIRDLRSHWGERSSAAKDAEALARFADADALVIDDLGTSFGKDAELVQLFEVVNARDAYDLHTIITSNLNPQGLREVLGERIYSRLRDRAVLVVLEGEDNRKPV